MGLAGQNNSRSPYGGVEGGKEWGKKGERKIAFVLQTTTGDPCIVSPEIRWEIRKKKNYVQKSKQKSEIS